jgi:5-methylcytosine-specific restriction endonuclease McrA
LRNTFPIYLKKGIKVLVASPDIFFMLPYRILGWHPVGLTEFSAGFRLNLLGDERHSTIEEPFMYHHVFNYRLRKNRLLAFKKQKGRCYYCHAPMWSGKPEEFTSSYGISIRQAKRFQCTAEHLLARQDGGTDERKNIVAACYFCNSTRHHPLNALSPVKYREKVLRRIRSQKWHPMECHHML